jgi:hypothetical protein
MIPVPRIALVLATTAAALAAVPSLAAQQLDDLDQDTKAALHEVRAATEKYGDVEVALADGYLKDPGNLCTTAAVEGLPAELGGMGIHFFRPDLLQITAMGPRVAGAGTHTDFLQPAVLVYFPDESGALRLGAVENLVFENAWKSAGSEGPPQFHGVPYVHRIDDPATAEVDEAHMFEPHYELHVWLYEPNPTGIFSPYNTSVGCDHHDGPKTMAEAMALMAAGAPTVDAATP